MPQTRPDPKTLIGQDPSIVPLSVQRVLAASSRVDTQWIGPDDAKELSKDETKSYELAHTILKYLAIEAPRTHKSGHPGGPLSAFTFCYGLLRRRNPQVDAALRMSAGHLSVLAYGLQYLGGRGKGDKRLESPQSIIETFRTADGLPGHCEADIGDIPFGFGPLGKGLSNGAGHALGWKMQGIEGITDVLMGDGDTQEGQVMEAARLAAHLKLDNLMVHIDLNDIQLSDIPSEVVAADLAAIFHAMGWAVLEVQDGNNPMQVEAALDAADALVGKGRPICICYYTTMGHGLEIMEKAANEGSAKYHGSPMSDEDAETELAKLPPLETVVTDYAPYRQELMKRYEGAPAASEKLKVPSFPKRILTTEKGAARKDFGATHIKQLMATDKRVIVLHGDLAGSGGYDKVEKEFPNRVINCGAAEANMYMMAAGLRQTGMLPVTYTFAAFGTNEARANARLIDINSAHIPCSVIHDCTHAGLSVGEDGETHQERNYLNIPFDNTQVWSTADSNQAAAMVEKSMELISEGRESVYVFMPRDGHEQIKTPDGEILYGEKYTFDGKADLLRGNGDSTDHATIVATGITVHDAIAAADELKGGKEGISVRVINVACIQPIDASAIIQAALETQHLIVAEDHNSLGGLATQVANIIADFNLPCSLRRLGVDHYFPSATFANLKIIAGLDANNIADVVQDEVRTEVCGGEDVFASCIDAMNAAQQHSRYAEGAHSFVQKLISEKGYMDSLREQWKSRACSVEEIPTNEELVEKLKG